MTIQIHREYRSYDAYGPNNVVIHPSHCADSNINLIEIVEHTENIVITSEYLVSFNMYEGITFLHRAFEYKLKSDGVLTQEGMEFAVPLGWWGRKIKNSLDFDHHPGNTDIHQYLIGREPKYQSDRIYITASGRVLVDTTVFGWISPKMIDNKYLPNGVKDEIRMAKNIFKIA
jgi:hypothetical protein